MIEKHWFTRWIAYRLPKRVVYWALIRAGAKVTTGEFANTVVPDLSFVEALKRYEEVIDG